MYYNNKKERHAQLSSSLATVQRSVAPCGPVPCRALHFELTYIKRGGVYVHITRACGVGVVSLGHRSAWRLQVVCVHQTCCTIYLSFCCSVSRAILLCGRA